MTNLSEQPAGARTSRRLPASERRRAIVDAALDVFSTEPTTTSPLFELDAVVVTPHLGASTRPTGSSFPG